jgi:hypothetical protein
MRTSFGPARLTVLELQRDEDVLTVYRIVRAGGDEAQLLDSLRSHYELN